MSPARLRRQFVVRHKIPNRKIELLVYIYYVAFYSFLPVAAILFWSDFRVNAALTLTVATIAGLIIYLRLRSRRSFPTDTDQQ